MFCASFSKRRSESIEIGVFWIVNVTHHARQIGNDESSPYNVGGNWGSTPPSKCISSDFLQITRLNFPTGDLIGVAWRAVFPAHQSRFKHCERQRHTYSSYWPKMKWIPFVRKGATHSDFRPTGPTSIQAKLRSKTSVRNPAGHSTLNFNSKTYILSYTFWDKNNFIFYKINILYGIPPPPKGQVAGSNPTWVTRAFIGAICAFDATSCCEAYEFCSVFSM